MQLIQELKEKSMKVMPIGYDTVKYVFDYNVFAKLIIEECTNVIRKEFGQHYIADELENHFGKELSKL